MQKARFKNQIKKIARAPQEFRLSLFASPKKQVQKSIEIPKEPPSAIGGAGDTLPHVEKSSQTKLVHAALDKQYRTLLEQPVPRLGNLTPRSAARTKSGREKLAVWLKHLENRSRQPEATDPMATYDFTWLWRELKVEHLRR